MTHPEPGTWKQRTFVTTLDRGAESDRNRGAESDTLSSPIGGPRVTNRGAESDTPRRNLGGVTPSRTNDEEPDRVSAEGDLGAHEVSTTGGDL